MANLGTLVTNTIANVAPFQKGMKKMQTSAKGASKAMTTLKSAAASLGVVLGIGTLVKAVGYSIRAFQEQELAATQLRTVLRSTGHAAGLTATQLTSMAKSLASLSMFSDEAIIKSQSLLLTFTNIGEKAFPLAQQTILDMAAAMDEDLKGATIRLGKALNDPIKGVTALADVGVSFTDQQRDQIKVLMATNDLLGAQKVILNELAKEFGGSAAAAAGTFAGKVALVQEKFQDLAAALGKDLVEPLLLIMRFLEEAIADAERLGIIKAAPEAKVVEPMRVARLEETTQEDVDVMRKAIKAQRANRELLAKEITSLKWPSMWGQVQRSIPFGGIVEKSARDEERKRKYAELSSLDRAIRLNEEKAAKMEAAQTPEHFAAIKESSRQQRVFAAAQLGIEKMKAREEVAKAQNELAAAKAKLEKHEEGRGTGPVTTESVRLQEAIDTLSDAVTQQKEALDELKES